MNRPQKKVSVLYASCLLILVTAMGLQADSLTVIDTATNIGVVVYCGDASLVKGSSRGTSYYEWQGTESSAITDSSTLRGQYNIEFYLPGTAIDSVLFFIDYSNVDSITSVSNLAVYTYDRDSSNIWDWQLMKSVIDSANSRIYLPEVKNHGMQVFGWFDLVEKNNEIVVSHSDSATVIDTIMQMGVVVFCPDTSKVVRSAHGRFDTTWNGYESSSFIESMDLRGRYNADFFFGLLPDSVRAFIDYSNIDDIQSPSNLEVHQFAQNGTGEWVWQKIPSILDSTTSRLYLPELKNTRAQLFGSFELVEPKSTVHNISSVKKSTTMKTVVVNQHSIRFHSVGKSETSIRLYDFRGREIARIFNGIAEIGFNEITISGLTSRLPVGSYLAVIDNGISSSCAKLSINR